MTRLQQDVRHYVRVARKTKGQLKKFDEFNLAYKTKLPTNGDSEVALSSFVKSLKRARAVNGVPVQGRLYNLYNALVKLDSPVVNAPVKKEMIPPPSMASLKPVSIRTEKVQEVEVKESPVKKQKIVSKPLDFNMDVYKVQLEEWKAAHPQSKLNNETQIVYFVPNEPIENYEHFSTKLTKSTGSILEKGGLFKMRSGLKKEILGVDSKIASDIISKVTKGGKGPFFLPIQCVTGAKNCNC